MNNLINVTGIPTIDVLSNYSEGKFRFVTKTRAGFISCNDARDFENERFLKHPETLLSQYKKGALLTVQFQAHPDGHWLTVFARVGKKIHFIDESILLNLKVGTINQLWYNTELFSTRQYGAVNTKTWDSYAFRQNSVNETEEVAA